MASVALNDHFEEFIRKQVEKGRFNNASEVVRAGLRLLEDAEAEREEKLHKLDEAIARGLAEAEAGLGKPAEEVFDRLEAKFRAMPAKRGQ
jgi:antitoxin ParD1/3/4